ncbi:MAG: hypothetical protein WEA58_11490 [Balneolaceae bacterium]
MEASHTKSPINPEIEKARQLLRQAKNLRDRSDEIFQEAVQIFEKEVVRAMREQEDKLINRKQAIDLLWFDSYRSLRRWEDKVHPLGYMEFEDDKILRSEVLRFIDDYQSGVIHQKLHR